MASSSGQARRGRPSVTVTTAGGLSSQVPGSGSKGKGPASNKQPAADSSMESTQLKNINWDTPRTEILVQWLLSHPANCRILFSDKNSGDLPPSLSSTSTERPVGHNKKEVQAMITQAIFEDDSVYKDMYTASAAKFQVSVGNRLNT
ncbi:hypothetical protein M404DRAFT_34196 [Pisolithus tinctorius Marx 270]|uniref:Uncharacterized protein n=1 Tax=Pisolithus tinctorius Marx 270 TaxID=870435 RepID=A0A0C3IEB2_PISTI|nr:hypothetical protein M404DRAFT_34196 [Pisolithus tinctorius Marx 270]